MYAVEARHIYHQSQIIVVSLEKAKGHDELERAVNPLFALIQEEIYEDEGSDETAGVVGGVHGCRSYGEASDEEAERRLSIGRSPNIDRVCAAADQLFYTDYFAPIPLFPEALFHGRFRMPRRLFARVIEQMTPADSYFVQRPDALGVLGFSPRQTLLLMRMLCYGICADVTDEYVRIAKSTVLEILKHATKVVMKCFGEE